MSIAAYQQTIAETEDHRRIEYRLFLRITLELEKFVGAATVTEDMKTALWRNQELWSTLRADLLSEGNELPAELRAGLVSLSFSVDNHTVKVLDGSRDVRLLVEVNRSVIAGLKGNAGAAAQGGGLEVVHGT